MEEEEEEEGADTSLLIVGSVPAASTVMAGGGDCEANWDKARNNPDIVSTLVPSPELLHETYGMVSPARIFPGDGSTTCGSM